MPKAPDQHRDVAVLIRLPQELRDALAQRAREEDRSVASLLRVAARHYIERGVRQP